jgi:hypothetical protein
MAIALIVGFVLTQAMVMVPAAICSPAFVSVHA